MKEFNPDSNQQKVIDFFGGYSLVLAAPGCGKTEILSHRVLKAHTQYGVLYKDMLCVTFTNRASREMKERIIETIGEVPNDLYVGNLHRFCVRFLFDNEIIPIDTGIMDDTDQEDLIREFFENVNYSPKAWEIQAVINTASAIREHQLNIPLNLRSHQKSFKFEGLANAYLKFLHENKMIDFDDILFKTYISLQNPLNKELTNSSYSWIQVDEVQDLNPLQIAILDSLATEDCTFMYLGDERQAIFSFLGAKHECIVQIQNKCEAIIHLSNNYRCPMYLLDMLNDYATDVIKIETSKLPSTTNSSHIDDALTLVGHQQHEPQHPIISALTRQIYFEAPSETVGILVRTNKEADEISESLTKFKVNHLKITNRDMFKMIPFKTLHSHFSVVCLDTCYNDWARIMYQTKAIEKLSEARRCVRKMRDLALTPRDLLDYEDSTYIMNYCNSFENKDIVIFDTETTGLDIFNDDIIQIAACKLHNGEIVPGSEIDIIIETQKDIPTTLKNGYVNPMIEEYKKRSTGLKNNQYESFMNAQDAFKFFIDYIGDYELLGHNSNFDIHILENNIKRRTNLNFCIPTFWDTLLVSRLLDPNIRSHALENLLKHYELEGANSHNAIDDVRATVSLAKFCAAKAKTVIDNQKAFISHDILKNIQRKLIKKYLPIYKHTKDKLFSTDISTENTFEFEFEYIYNEFLDKKYISKISRFEYMSQLFKKVVIKDEDKYFYNQLVEHLFEFRTFNEADLYQNGIINENIHIMTIHKAKGLQFDTVIVLDVSYGKVPHFNTRNPSEDARVLYVAMSRARKRVIITYENELSEFINIHDKVKEHFYDMPPTQKERLIKMDEMFIKFG